MVERLCPAPLEGPLNVAEQNNTVLVRVVVGFVYVGFIKNDTLPVTPTMPNPIHIYIALVIIGCC